MVAAAAIDTYGRLDVLYNNVAMPSAARLVDTTEDMWDATIATNLSAAFWACRAAIPRMVAGDGGVIVNRSSVLDHHGRARLCGLRLRDRRARRAHAPNRGRVRPGVRANVIAPGVGDSELVVALFLAGDASATHHRRGHRLRPPTGSRRMSRVVVVTGGASGVGEAIANRFASDGDFVVVADVDELRGRQVADNLTAAGLPAESETVDVTSEGEVAAMFDAIAERHGRLDALVCSAAAASRASVVDCTDDDWQHVLDVNLKGPFLCCKHGIPAIAGSGGGAVVLARLRLRRDRRARRRGVPRVEERAREPREPGRDGTRAEGVRVNVVAPPADATRIPRRSRRPSRCSAPTAPPS